MFWILLALLALLLIFIGLHYNWLVRDRNLVKEAWSGIDVQLKRRADLVPALVEVVKGYAKHEQETLKKTTSLRSSQEVVAGLKNLFALAESYPQLKADQNFLDLQENLTAIEDALQYARRYYNGCVRNYNTRVQKFPSLLVANVFHFKEKDFFEVEYVTDRKVPDVAL